MVVEQYLDKHLRECSENNTFSVEQLNVLNENKVYIVQAVIDAFNQEIIRNDATVIDAFLLKVYRYVLDVNSAIFKQALADHLEITGTACDDQTFYSDYWLQDVSLGNRTIKFSLKRRSLYVLCFTPDFTDHELDLVRILNGKSDDALIESIYEDAKKHNLITSERTGSSRGGIEGLQKPISFSKECCAVDGSSVDFSSILQSIESAANLVQRVNNNFVTELLDRVVNQVREELTSKIWECKDTFEVPVQTIDDSMKEYLVTAFKEKGFLLEFVSESSMKVTLMPSDKVFGNDEVFILEELSRCDDGKIFFSLVNTVRTVILPELLTKIVSEVVNALNEVSIGKTSLEFSKVATHTSVYQVLFNDLAAKGYSIVDSENQFILSWEVN